MFSCCRCIRSGKKDKKSKTDNLKVIDVDADDDAEDSSEFSESDIDNVIDDKLNVIVEDNNLNEIEESPVNMNTSIDEGIDNNALSNINNSQSYTINFNNTKLDNTNNIDKQSSLNNYEDDTTIENFSNSFSYRKTDTNLDNFINQKLNGLDNYSNINNYGATNTNSSNNTNIDELEDNFYVIYNNDDVQRNSCISRRSSSKSSFKKKVNINDSTEVIPSSDIVSVIDDDEVFSDSIPPKIARGDMCAPYVPIKRSSIQEHVEYLPEWFNEERFYSENGGILEPPVTPVGRDELALKRHRLYSHLLKAAQAAVEHHVRFDPLGPKIADNYIDCDPDIKPSISKDLEHLVNRLEKLVERLERSISARELEIANKAFNSVVEKKRRSFDIEAADLPPLPLDLPRINLNKRIEILENSLNKINNSYNSSKKNSPTLGDGSLENIPTVLDEFLIEEFIEPIEPFVISDTMSVNGYQDIVSGPLVQYINLSNKIGGDVAKHSQFVKQAFDAQLQYITLATQCAQPPQNRQVELLKPTSDQISAIQTFREQNRTSPYFNHLSAISESIPALGWVCVSPTPGPHVKEMNDAGQFYTNRVLKDWKGKDASHVEWARAWTQTLTELQQYIKQFHTTGLVWSGKGAAKGAAPPPPPPSALGCPPPPPPPVLDMSDLNLNATGDERSALFAEINRGADITKGLKKVTSDMQTHKNPTLRTGPAPFKTPTGGHGQVTAPSGPINKPPVFNKDGKKWLIEYQTSNPSLLIENAEMNNVVYMYKCDASTLTVKGKINSVVMDSCKKCSLLIDSVVASIEFVNCQGIQMQVLHKCPTISIDKTDGCQMYLSKESLEVEIISSKSSEMNVLIPKDNGDYAEQPIPEQFKTLIKGNTIQTTCIESLG